MIGSALIVMLNILKIERCWD